MSNTQNDAYNIYDYGCSVKHGDEIKLNISISAKNYTEDAKRIQDVLDKNKAESIRELIDSSKKKEDEILKKYQTLLTDEYTKVANQTRLYKLSLESYNAMQIKAKHTNNQWVSVDGSYSGNKEEISNATYRMIVSVYENTKYDNESKTCKPFEWQVTWTFSTNSPLYDSSQGIYNKVIDGQDRKKFTDKDKALKYIDGRKKVYANYFVEEFPPIPTKYAKAFMMNLILLPNYKVESEV
jgi:hypothetical protein